MEADAAAPRLRMQTGSLISVKPPGFGVWLKEFLEPPNPLSAASSRGAITAEVFSALARYLGSRLNKTSCRDGVEICSTAYWEAVRGTTALAEVLCPVLYIRGHECLACTRIYML